MKIKFVGVPGLSHFKSGSSGEWQKGQIKDLPIGIASQLLGLYKSPFIVVASEVEPALEKELAPPSSNKMVEGGKLNKDLPKGAKVFGPDNLRKSKQKR
jgi:hypothetical protein